MKYRRKRISKKYSQQGKIGNKLLAWGIPLLTLLATVWIGYTANNISKTQLEKDNQQSAYNRNEELKRVVLPTLTEMYSTSVLIATQADVIMTLGDTNIEDLSQNVLDLLFKSESLQFYQMLDFDQPQKDALARIYANAYAIRDVCKEDSLDVARLSQLTKAIGVMAAFVTSSTGVLDEDQQKLEKIISNFPTNN